MVFLLLTALTLQDAKLLYEQGLNDYNAGRFEKSIQEFQKSYEISHAPGLLYNIGQAYRLGGDCTNANKFYQDYIQKEGDRQKQKIAEKQIRECADALTTPIARTRAVQMTTSEASTRATHTTTTKADTRADQGTTTASHTRAIAATTTTSQTRSFVLALSGLVLAATGSYLVFSAGSDYDRLQMSCGHMCNPTTWDGLGMKEKLGYGLLALGGVGVAGGVTLWFHDSSAGVAVGGRF